MKDSEIASLVGLTPSGLARIVGTPEYRDVQEAVLAAHVASLDKALADQVAETMKDFAEAVKASLEALLNVVTQRKDLRAAVSAAREILDRDPERTFTKNQERISSASLPNDIAEQADLAVAAIRHRL